MGNHQNKDFVASELEYDSPVSNTQAQADLTFQSLDLVTEGQRGQCKLIQRLEFPRGFRGENDRPHACFFSFTTLCSVASAVSKKRLTPRAA